MNLVADTIEGAYQKKARMDSVQQKLKEFRAADHVLPRHILQPVNKNGKISYFKLSDEAKQVLGDFFAHVPQAKGNLDLGKVKISFGFVRKGYSGYALGHKIRLDEPAWFGLQNMERIAGQYGLLVHELSHTIQQRIVGMISFLNRYCGLHGELRMTNNYDVPDSLENESIMNIDLVSNEHHYTFDQYAERLRHEFLKYWSD